MFTDNPLHHEQSNQNGSASGYSSLFNGASQPVLKRADAKTLTTAHTSIFFDLGIQKPVTVRNHANGPFWAHGNASATTTAFGVVREQNRNTLFHHLPSTPFKNFLTNLFASHFLDENLTER